MAKQELTYKNWLLSFMTITPPNRYVYGEQLLKGDLMHTLMIGYKQPAWAIMAGDVYKRQIIDRGEIIDQETYHILESLRKESIPVSYTHLDVYKRQMFGVGTVLVRSVP